MQHREFRQLATEVFGALAGRLCRDQVLRRLENRTADEALSDGVQPAVVWHALCDEMDIDESDRWGIDPKRLAPPRH